MMVGSKWATYGGGCLVTTGCIAVGLLLTAVLQQQDQGEHQTPGNLTDLLQEHLRRVESLLDERVRMLVDRFEALEAKVGEGEDVRVQLREYTSSVLHQVGEMHKAADMKQVQRNEELRGTMLNLLTRGGPTEGHVGTTGLLSGSAKCLEQPQPAQHLSDRPEIRGAIEAAIELVPKREPPWLQNRTLPAEPPAMWRQHSLKPHGSYGFIQFSGYRSNAKQFAAPGLAASALNTSRQLQGCVWTGSNGDQMNGKLAIKYEGWPFGQQYEAAVLQCTLDYGTGTRGGHLVAQMDNEQFVMLVEPPTLEALEPEGPFPHEIVFCSAGLHDGMVARHVWEWLEYHRTVHLVDHFYLYDAGGVDASMRSMLAPYLERSMATLTDLRAALLFTVKLWGQPLAIADCIQRTRYTAQWVFMGDVDEYLHVPPPATLQTILHKYEDRPWLTHGSIYADVRYCQNRTSSKQFAVELMTMASRAIKCDDQSQDPELCLGVVGHRKYFLNPRKVDVASTHKVFEPLGGVDLNARTELRHFHYRGLGTVWRSETICSRPVEAASEKLLRRNEQVARIVPSVRECPLGSPRECFAMPHRQQEAMDEPMLKQRTKFSRQESKFGISPSTSNRPRQN